MLAHEEKKIVRRFVVYTLPALREWARTPCIERYAHEVVFGHARLYFDVDVEWSLFHAEHTPKRVEAVVERARGAAREKFGDDLDFEALWLDGTRIGHKYSMHIVVSVRRRDGVELLFASAAHVEAFVRACHFDAAALDMSVYSRNHSLRALGSRKLTGASVELWPCAKHHAGVAALVATHRRRHTLPWTIFQRSLITLPVANSELVYMDALPALKRRRQHPVIDAWPEALKQFVDVHRPPGMKSVKCLEPNALYLVVCASGRCEVRLATVHREHRSNDIYYLVDVTKARYKQHCYSPHCANATRVWRPIDGGVPAVRAADVATKESLAVGVLASLLRIK